MSEVQLTHHCPRGIACGLPMLNAQSQLLGFTCQMLNAPNSLSNSQCALLLPYGVGAVPPVGHRLCVGARTEAQGGSSSVPRTGPRSTSTALARSREGSRKWGIQGALPPGRHARGTGERPGGCRIRVQWGGGGGGGG